MLGFFNWCRGKPNDSDAAKEIIRSKLGTTAEQYPDNMLKAQASDGSLRLRLTEDVGTVGLCANTACVFVIVLLRSVREDLIDEAPANAIMLLSAVVSGLYVIYEKQKASALIEALDNEPPPGPSVS